MNSNTSGPGIGYDLELDIVIWYCYDINKQAG